MSRNRSSQHSSKFRLDLKTGGGIVLILAVLVLAVNAILAQRGRPLPQEVTDLAQEMVETSLPELVSGAETESSTNTPVPQEPTPQATATSLPAPQGSAPTATLAADPGSVPWAGADDDFDYYVLALSWQPAFCETAPDKVECVTQSACRFDAAHFALHGLWPSVRGDRDHTFNYCDLSPDLVRQDRGGEWCDLPELDVSEAVWADLATFMPGTASCLHHHEWYKHGTCAGMSPEAYFALSNRLVALFAESEFNRYVAERVGEQVRRGELLDQFEVEFGPGASDFLSLRCDEVGDTRLLTEIQVVLRSDLSTLDDLGALFPAERVSPLRRLPATRNPSRRLAWLSSDRPTS